MRSGALRHYVWIETPTESQDAYGAVIHTWATLAEVWANREDLSGRELWTSQQTYADVTTRFTIRHIPGISAKMQIVSAGMTYNIRSVVDPDGRARESVILASRAG
jgi:SPP1 family predicted phage head-tail adaptor